MPNIPKKSRSKKPASPKKSASSRKTSSPKLKKQSDVEFQGLVPAMMDFANLLPEPFRSHAHAIIGIFGVAVIAIIVIYVIEAFVATTIGHPELINTFFAADIIGVGVVAVAAVVQIVKKSVK
jgi:hypothetical protein